MGPKKGSRVRKIEIPTNTPTEFELGDMAADIQCRREEREAREREEEAQKQRGRQERGNYTLSRGPSGQKVCKDKQKQHRDTEAGGEADTSQSHSILILIVLL